MPSSSSSDGLVSLRSNMVPRFPASHSIFLLTKPSILKLSVQSLAVLCRLNSPSALVTALAI